MQTAIVLVALVAVALAQQGPPPFLRGAPPAVLTEFQQLLGGAGDKTEAQVDRDVEGWVSRQSPQIQGEFNKFKAQLNQGKQQAEQAHQASLAKFSPAARAADAQLSAVANDPNLTGKAKQQKIQGLIAGLAPAVKAEIEKEMQG